MTESSPKHKQARRGNSRANQPRTRSHHSHRNHPKHSRARNNQFRVSASRVTPAKHSTGNRCNHTGSTPRHRNHRIRPLQIPFLIIAYLFTAAAVTGIIARMLPADMQTLPCMPALVALTPWFIIPAAVALLIAVVNRRWALAIISALCVCVQLCWQSPFYIRTDRLSGEAEAAVTTVNTDDGYASVMTANCYKGLADAGAIVSLVAAHHIEILALQEITEPFIAELEEAGINDYLPYSITVSTENGGIGNGIWTVAPMSDPVDVENNSTMAQMPAASVSFGGREVRFVSVHTISPRPGRLDKWRTTLEQVQELAERDNITYVFMGDFNATNDHTPFRSILADKYKDAAEAAGAGLLYTWAANCAIPAFTTIDHIVVADSITVGQVETVLIGDTDHKSLLATLDFTAV